jgi:flavodoxin
MNALVIFDSDPSDANSGTTDLIADAIADAIAAELGEGTAAVSVVGLDADSLTGVDLLVVGCPVTGRRPSPRMRSFLAKLSHGTLRGVRAAAFDTRVRIVLPGDAAGRISHTLASAGAHIAAAPRGFIVEGRSGSLVAGEVDRAREWAGAIAKG